MTWLTKGTVLRTAIVTAAVLVVIQLIPYRVSNPSARATPPWDSPRTEALAIRACADCHSNRTNVLGFERIAPLSWWIKGHVDEGRSALNFDDWPRVGEGGREAAETVREGSMPPRYYTWFGLHAGAKLTQAERDELERGLIATFGSRR